MAKVEDIVRANGANKQERELETPKKIEELCKKGNAISV